MGEGSTTKCTRKRVEAAGTTFVVDDIVCSVQKCADALIGWHNFADCVEQMANPHGKLRYRAQICRSFS